ncbi:MAG: DUF389 domain-containing protein [Propionicimonas sp.]|nr:DUF389 domain-containing protein [Propionicimonas sp.]
MLHLRLAIPAELTEDVLLVLTNEPTVSSLSVVRGAGLEPPGDLVYADVARETANALIDQLRSLDVPHRGTMHIEQVPTWLSKAALDAEDAAPGSSADAVVWPEVGQRAYGDSELNGTYLVFMVLATMIAAIGIALDSQILLIGAMVLGPEFGPVAAIALALVLRRRTLFGYALRTLLLGFAIAIALTTVMALVARAAGWVQAAAVLAPRPGTDFIYHPDGWSLAVAVLAAVAGVVSLTSGRMGGMAGVFISVTTVPAAANVALGLAFWLPEELIGSTAQLLINLSAMLLAGWLTLLVRQGAAGRLPGNPFQHDLVRRRRSDQLRKA